MLLGKSVSEVYNQWQQSEPNDLGGNEDCVHLNLQGDLNDFPCDGKSYFICKKSLQTLEWNYPCNMSNLGMFFTMNIVHKLQTKSYLESMYFRLKYKGTYNSELYNIQLNVCAAVISITIIASKTQFHPMVDDDSRQLQNLITN